MSDSSSEANSVTLAAAIFVGLIVLAILVSSAIEKRPIPYKDGVLVKTEQGWTYEIVDRSRYYNFDK